MKIGTKRVCNGLVIMTVIQTDISTHTMPVGIGAYAIPLQPPAKIFYTKYIIVPHT